MCYPTVKASYLMCFWWFCIVYDSIILYNFIILYNLTVTYFYMAEYGDRFSLFPHFFNTDNRQIAATIFNGVQRYSTTVFDGTRRYSTVFNGIRRRYSTVFDGIQRYSTVFDVIRRYSTFFRRLLCNDLFAIYNEIHQHSIEKTQFFNYKKNYIFIQILHLRFS